MNITSQRSLMQRHGSASVGAGIIALALAAVVPAAQAVLPYSANLINAYQLNEQTSGQLNNSVDESFLDTAPNGTPQNHDDFNDGASDGPAWVSGAPMTTSFHPGYVGDGRGLQFTRSDVDQTRFEPWMNVAQGNYTDGGSFTVMVRMKPTQLTDDTNYYLLGNSSNYIRLAGLGGSTTARIDVRLREGAGGGEDDWLLDSFGNGNGGGAPGPSFTAGLNAWQNVFLIYNQDSTLTIALDDGTTFNSLTSSAPPASFDSSANGFSDSAAHWFMGNINSGTDTFDGIIESVYIWDRALTLAEANDINLTVPEPSTVLLMLVGGSIAWKARRKAS